MTKRVKIIIILLVVFLSGLFFWRTTNRFLYPLRAAGEPVKCFFDKDTLTVSSGDEININLFCNSDPANKISFITASLKYPTDILEFVPKPDDYADAPILSNNFKLTTLARVHDDATNGVISLSRLSTGSNADLPSGLFGWGTVTFRVKSSVTGFPKTAVVNLNNDVNAWEIVGPGHTYAPQLSEGNIVTITINEGTGGGGGGGDGTGLLQGTLLFSPTVQTATVGEAFSYDLVLKSTSQNPSIPINAWDVVIGVGDGVDVTSINEPTYGDPGLMRKFDDTTPTDSSNSAVLTPTDFPSPTTSTSKKCTQLSKSWDRATKKIHLTYTCIADVSSLPSIVTTHIALKGTAEASGKLQIISQQVTGLSADGSINGAFTLDTNAASYTIGSGGKSGNVKLNLALKFQGIVTKPKKTDAMKVKVGVGGGSLKEPVFGTGSFTPDNEGIWHGSVSINVPPGSNYKILVKGPQHLQKKICDAKPTETFPGTYSCDLGKITLTDGSNDLNLSSVYLLVGDLPDQDGIVNSYDISLVRNLLDKSDDESLRVADLNRDGAVNAQDYSLVIASLSIRNDEQ